MPHDQDTVSKTMDPTKDELVEVLILGAIIAHVAAEESEGWLVETLGLDRLTIRAIRHDAQDAASAIMGTRLQMPDGPLPADAESLQKMMAEHSKWQSPLRTAARTAARRLASKIAALKGQTLSSLGTGSQSESTAHDQKSSNDPTPSSPSTDKPEYVRRLESEVDYYRSLRKHHPDDPQWKGRDIAERLEKETGAARQTPDHKPQSETWMIIPNKPESKPQSEKTGKRPIASEWMSNLRVDGDWDNYKDYGSLTLSTIFVMMQDFAEHYHKAIATDYDAAIKAQEWPNDLGVLVGRTITTRLNGGVPAASPVIRIEKHDVRQSMLRVIMPDSKAVLIRPELRELLSIDPPLETPESGEDVFLPDGMMSVEQRAKNIRAHTSLNDAMLHIVLDDRNWRTALRPSPIDHPPSSPRATRSADPA